jgi:hypothetical protein
MREMNKTIYKTQYGHYIVLTGKDISERLAALETGLPECKVCKRRFAKPELTWVVTAEYEIDDWGRRRTEQDGYYICEGCKGVKAKNDK